MLSDIFKVVCKVGLVESHAEVVSTRSNYSTAGRKSFTLITASREVVSN